MKSRIWFVAAAALAACLLVADLASAQGPGRGGRGGRPSFDKLLEAFDDNEDGELTEDEVPPRVWARLKNADANDDGSVTRKEFDSYRPGQ